MKIGAIGRAVLLRRRAATPTTARGAFTTAWSHLDGAKDERTRFVAVLEIPPVESAETAVRVQIVKDSKGIK